jgi:hypothetical protein
MKRVVVGSSEVLIRVLPLYLQQQGYEVIFMKKLA